MTETRERVSTCSLTNIPIATQDKSALGR